MFVPTYRFLSIPLPHFLGSVLVITVLFIFPISTVSPGTLSYSRHLEIGILRRRLKNTTTATKVHNYLGEIKGNAGDLVSTKISSARIRTQLDGFVRTLTSYSPTHRIYFDQLLGIIKGVRKVQEKQCDV